MDETQAASSTAVVEAPVVEVERGPLVNLSAEERSEYRKTGELPKPKVEAPAPPKIESESAAEADAAPSKQEHTEKGKQKPKPTAEDRIAQLEATIEKIRKGAGIERKAEPAPAPEQPKQPAQPQNYAEYRKAFRPSDFIAEYAKQNPDASYEDATAAMADHLAEVRDQFRANDERQRSLAADLNHKVTEARQRYGDKFDEVLAPTLNTIVQSQQILPVVKQLINESEVLPDLLFTLGSNEAELNKFLSMPPGKQARYVALTESLIREELEGKPEPVKVDPPTKTQTSAPKPPAEVGGRAASPKDEVESAVQANDYRRASAAWTRQAVARMKG